jgi:RNA polymerase sigma-70 factor (ECF subfamily)
MKLRRDLTVSPKFIDDVCNEEAAIASAYSLSDKGDMTLVAAAKNENRQAFEVLVERHARRIFFAARRMTRTREDAEDVVQQSLQQAFVHLHQFEGESSFSTWLTRISINEALILLRKGRGLREMLVNDSTEGEEALFALEIPDSGPNPEDSYSLRERQRILISALNELPHGTRRAIQLRDLDERSSEETARIMGISVGAVKARVFHGRRKLRERLRRYFGSAWASGRDASRTIGNTRHLSQNQVACNACG